MPELTLMQNANPNECGSCQFYRARDPGDGFGECRFEFPPFVAFSNERTVHDTDTCSLYKVRNLAGEPVEFVQKRVWRAGQPPR